MASYKRAHAAANTMDKVVHRTASWTTTTTTVTSNIPGTTKETAILLLDDDSKPSVHPEPAKKNAREVDAQAKGSFPCGTVDPGFEAQGRGTDKGVGTTPDSSRAGLPALDVHLNLREHSPEARVGLNYRVDGSKKWVRIPDDQVSDYGIAKFLAPYK